MLAMVIDILHPFTIVNHDELATKTCQPNLSMAALHRDNSVATGAFTVEADREVVTKLAQVALDSNLAATAIG